MNSTIHLAKILAGRISENSPIILTGLAIAGLVSTSVLAVKATPKAMEMLANERFDRNQRYIIEGGDPNLSAYDAIRICYKCYIPAIAVGAVSICCIVGANSISSRRTAALAGVYAITETAFQEYQTKVAETIGERRELKVRDEIAADRIKANPTGTNEIIITGKGDLLCYDSLTGRYFKSSVEHIRRTVNDLNHQLLTDMFITLDELHTELGLSGTVLGGELGWHIDRGLIDITFSSQLNESSEPCLVLDYRVVPRFLQ